MSSYLAELRRISWPGVPLVDSLDQVLGAVQHGYADQTGVVRFLAVDLDGRDPSPAGGPGTGEAESVGTSSSVRLAPCHNITPVEGGLRLPYTRKAVQTSPPITDSGPLPAEVIAALYSHYGSAMDQPLPHGDPAVRVGPIQERGRATPDGAGSLVRAAGQEAIDLPPASMTQPVESLRPEGRIVPDAAGDAGAEEVIEIPVYAEELVKLRVVKEVIRIRKRWTTELYTADANLRREEIEVLPDPSLRAGSQMDSHR